ncbi:MAG: S8 family serine peptidase [Oscillospiraceae bacterium]|nr:S8 family serine peptidase [Oscillospiraceae bacterium]
MRKNLGRRIISLAAALLLSAAPAEHCSFRLPASAQTAAEEEAIPMTVMLGDDALPCTDSQSTAAVRTAMQNAVFAAICRLYPEAEMRYQFVTLMNGFSCMMPQSLTDTVLAMPQVTAVEPCREITLQTDLSDAMPRGGLPAYYEETGCTGAGEVICFIDSELDTTHPMFAPLAEDVPAKLTQDDIKEIIDTVGLHINVDPEKAFISSKVPFAADYLDLEDPYAVANPDINQYHGTHVAGIAAGNQITTEDNRQIAGIAKDAQIIFMAIDRMLVTPSAFSTPGADMLHDLRHNLNRENDQLAAMIEDAVRLHADVINMSIGIDSYVPGEDHLITKAVNAATDAGVTVCIAAGNNGIDGKVRTDPAFPDHCTMNCMINEGNRALAVASADNPADTKFGVLEHDGKQILYSSFDHVDLQTQEDHFEYLCDHLSPGTYEYEYCGFGTDSDFDGKDLSGKFALVTRGFQGFWSMAYAARKAGALGVIAYNHEDHACIVPYSPDGVPVAVISHSDGQLLRNAKDKSVTLLRKHETVRTNCMVSSFSSWGMHSSLELRPDIMGIGGMVESAAYDGQTAKLSGTSMAAPYLSGCTAILKQYLKKQDSDLAGTAQERRIRNLLMTAAEPLAEDGMYVSPRRQGAGLVRMDRAMQNHILLTGAEGESKISLRDQTGTDFSFQLTLQNLGDKAVRFSDAHLELTTDQIDLDDAGRAILSGQQTLNCSADCGECREIAAGGTKMLRIHVTLDAEQAEELEKFFRYGFYIDGFLLLSGAENNPDISVPLSGFTGDYSKTPLTDYAGWGAHFHGTETSIESSRSFTEWAKYAEEFVTPFMTEEMQEYLDLCYTYMYHRECSDTSLDRFKEAQEAFAVKDREQESILYDVIESRFRMAQTAQNDPVDTVYISPNGDGIAEQPVFTMHSPYRLVVHDVKLMNADGTPVPTNEFTMLCLDTEPGRYGFSTGTDLLGLAEGEYIAETSVEMPDDAPEERRRAESFRVPVIVDLTPPEVQTELTHSGSRQLLRITASDSNLDGFFIFGRGRGGAAENYNPSKEIRYGRMPMYYMHKAVNAAYGNTLYNYEFINREEFQPQDETLPMFYNFMYRTHIGSAWAEQFDFADIIQAEPDENGVYTLIYDVTELECYSINTIDRAFNLTETAYNTINPQKVETVPNPLRPGVYIAEDGIYEFTEDTFRAVSFADPTFSREFHFTYNYEHKFDWGNFEIMQLIVDAPYPEKEFNDSFIMSLNPQPDGSVNAIGGFSVFLNGVNVAVQNLVRLENTDTVTGYLALGTDQAYDAFVGQYMARVSGQDVPETKKVTVGHDAVALFENSYADGKAYTIQVDLKTGTAMLPDRTTQQIDIPAWPKYGDFNCDGTVDVSDAVMLARFCAEDPNVNITSVGWRFADVNHDGLRNPDDVIGILRIIAKLDAA